MVRWSIIALLAIVLVIFAVSNRAVVEVTFWPLPATLEAPLYLVVVLTLLVGFLGGEIVAWIGGRRWRREARARGRRLEALERELAATQSRLPVASAPHLPADLPAAGSPREH